MGVIDAAASEDRLELLVALRTRLAEVIDEGCSPRDLVGISRRLLDVAQEIEVLKAADNAPTAPHLQVVDGDFDPSAV